MRGRRRRHRSIYPASVTRPGKRPLQTPPLRTFRRYLCQRFGAGMPHECRSWAGKHRWTFAGSALQVQALGSVRRVSLCPSRAIRPLFGCAGRFWPSGQSQTDVDSHIKGTRACARCGCAVAASSIWQKHACGVRSRRTSSGDALFRWRTHANEGMRTVERMNPGLAEAARPLSAAHWLRGCIF